MPEKSHDDMVSTGVREPLKMIEDLFGPVGLQKHVTGFFARIDIGKFDALSQPGLDSLDRRTEFEEDPERLELTLESNWLDVFTSPGAVAMEISASQGVHLLDFVFGTKLKEPFQPITLVLM
jgi:hypothetical protein